METDSTSPRRGQRVKKMSLRAQESRETKKLIHDSDGDETPVYFSEDSSEQEIYDLSEKSSAESDTSEDSESEVTKPKYLTTNKKETHPTGSKRTSHSYLIKSEDYFRNNSSKKNKTSSNTLDKLNKSRLSQEQLQKLLSAVTLSDNHKNVVSNLQNQNTGDFAKWICLLHEGFNILLYGLGSKRNILHQFQKKYLNDLPVIVVNGFFPSLALKEILDAIIVDILELKENPGNAYEAAELISSSFVSLPNLHLYLIIHNLEGEMLRASPKNQTVLANLASVKNIHLIASIDHVNTPLIWDHNKLSKFNFTWWDVTSFLPYMSETCFETSLMTSQTGSLALSSLRNVFLSLTSNSKGIYLVIVKYQLRNGSNRYYQGMLFKDLYSACREAFLVSSDLALRAQLTEFVDHKMVKFRRSADGAEYLVIPISNNFLQQFLNEQ